MLTFRTSAAGGNTVSGTSPSATITPAVGDLLIAFCQATGNSNAAPTCSDGNTGGTWTLIGTALSNGSANIISAFVRNATVPNTTPTVVTVACGAHTAAEVVVYALSGTQVWGANAILQFAKQINQAGATIPAPVFTNPPNPSSLILCAVGNITNPAGVAVTAGNDPTWTRDQNVGQTACGLSTEHTNNSLQSSTVTWGGTSASAFASFAIEVAVAAANAGVNASKLVSGFLAAPPIGVAASKAIVGVLPTAPIGVAVSKAYIGVLLSATNTNPPVWPSFTMPAGYISNPYSVSWDLAPAAAPTTYALAPGSGPLPPGLTLNSPSADLGSITGTPTTAGVYPFTLRATNAYGTADQAFSITISTPVGGGSVTYAG